MNSRRRWLVGALMAAGVVSAARADARLHFEDLVRMSDRVVVATVQSASGGSVRLPNGRDINLGVKDPASGMVFTPYRIVVSECLFDADDACAPGESEVSIPGGNVFDTVDGEQRLRTWEVAGAGEPMSRAGEELVLMLAKRGGLYVSLNDSGARGRVDRSSDPPSIRLSFGSPRFLSAVGLASERARIGAAMPSTARPSFTERVPLDGLKRIVALARQVPEPSSETLHATPTRAGADDAHALQRRRAGVRAGEDSE